MTSIDALALDVWAGTTPFHVGDDAVVSLDEARVPFALATLTVPYDPATVDKLDPRTDARLTLRLTRRFAGTDPLSDLSTEFAGKKLSDMTAAWAGLTLGHLTAQYGYVWNDYGFRASQYLTLDLGIRERVIDHAAGTVGLVVSSDEALLIDYGLMNAAGVSPSALTVADAVRLALSVAVPGAVLVTPQGAQVITADSAVWQPGISAWDYLSPLTVSAALRLWCDEQRVWHLEDPSTVVTPGQVSLSTTVSVVAATDTISRDGTEWYDGVVVTYQWTTADNIRHEQSDVAGSSTSSRTLHVVRESPFPRAGAAAARLRKVRGQGRVLSVAAVADLAAYPAKAASLSAPDTPPQTGWVQSVTWSLIDARMDVTTRGLVDTPPRSWVAGQADQIWTDVPVGMSWSTFDWAGVAA